MYLRARPLLGTLVEIRVQADSLEIARRAADAAFEVIVGIERLMSFHDPESELSLLNRRAHHRPLAVSQHTYAVLQRACELSALSDGVFDCTIGARLMDLDYLPRVVDAVARRSASYRDVRLLPKCQVSFSRPLALDLGGIAKGYAVDQAISALKENGAMAGLVNAGGDLRGFGDVQWSVAVRDPQAPTQLLRLRTITNEAIATTADYNASREHKGEWINPIIDPETQRPSSDGISVSVIAPTCIDADALTKIVWLSPELPRQLLRRLNARAIVIGHSTRERDAFAHASGAAR
jgi:thiamine biosynthesis lipoprotein